jgi:hypothetical protein
MSDRIVVPFAGEGSGVAPLSWGQLELWIAIVRQKSWFPIGGVSALDPATTVADVAAELGYLLSRYQAMRTRLRFAADGTPEQVLVADGEITLEVVEAGDADPAEVAAAVSQRYQDDDFDFARDWPVRMAVITSGGVPACQVSIVSHLVTDAFGAAVMLREVAARDTTPVIGMQPLAQARWQQSPAGRRQHAAAVRHWENVLRSMPLHRPAPSAGQLDPRHWRGGFTSTALHLAVRAIVDRTGVDSSPVLLALYAMAIARVTGMDPAVIRTVVNNRFRPGLADVVAFVAQNGVCVLAIADDPFDVVLDRARRCAMVAAKHAYFDPGLMETVIDAVTAERGPVLESACFFNDRRGASRNAGDGPAPTPAEIRAAEPATEMTWLHGQDEPFERLFIHLNDVPDTIAMQVFADTRFLSLADVETCLRSMEKIAVQAATDPGGPAPIRETTP